MTFKWDEMTPRRGYRSTHHYVARPKASKLAFIRKVHPELSWVAGSLLAHLSRRDRPYFFIEDLIENERETPFPEFPAP